MKKNFIFICCLLSLLETLSLAETSQTQKPKTPDENLDLLGVPDFFDPEHPADAQFMLLQKDIQLLRHDEALFHEMMKQWGDEHSLVIAFGKSLMTRSLSHVYRINMLIHENLSTPLEQQLQQWLQNNIA